MSQPTPTPAPHPAVWAVLMLPFGALTGFVSVGLTFMATKHGLSITDGALLNGANVLSQWLKWLWAPVVDVTLTPRRWHLIATVSTGLGVLAMSLIPLGPATLGLLLAVIAFTSLVNSLVGMAVEASVAATVAPEQVGRASAWLQAGNLGGAGFGGGLGLMLLEVLPAHWMAGAVMAVVMVACCAALHWVPAISRHGAPAAHEGAWAHVRWVVADLWATLRSRGGALAALLFMLPVGTGAAASVLTQAAVAAHWGAGAKEVALLQGTLAGVITAGGCFLGGWWCQRQHPRAVYMVISLALAAVASGMALAPATVTTFVVASCVYNLGVGIAYAGFTAVTLDAIGRGAGATKYSMLASISNFPIWWLGLLLGWVADERGAAAMLHTEALLGVLGVAIFALAAARWRVQG